MIVSFEFAILTHGIRMEFACASVLTVPFPLIGWCAGVTYTVACVLVFAVSITNVLKLLTLVQY